MLTVHPMFLRKVLNVPKATPTEMLYLELGCLPFRYLIQKRRLVFLHYLLNEDSESMVHRSLMTQCKNANPKDWTSTVMKDIQELDIKMTFDEIKVMKKSSLANILNKAIEDKALKDLNQIKIKHSNVLHLKHDYMKMKLVRFSNRSCGSRVGNFGFGLGLHSYFSFGLATQCSLCQVFILHCTTPCRQPGLIKKYWLQKTEDRKHTVKLPTPA